jgi:hypothetical protein
MIPAWRAEMTRDAEIATHHGPRPMATTKLEAWVKRERPARPQKNFGAGVAIDARICSTFRFT